MTAGEDRTRSRTLFARPWLPLTVAILFALLGAGRAMAIWPWSSASWFELILVGPYVVGAVCFLGLAYYRHRDQQAGQRQQVTLKPRASNVDRPRTVRWFIGVVVILVMVLTGVQAYRSSTAMGLGIPATIVVVAVSVSLIVVMWRLALYFAHGRGRSRRGSST